MKFKPGQIYSLDAMQPTTARVFKACEHIRYAARREGNIRHCECVDCKTMWVEVPL